MRNAKSTLCYQWFNEVWNQQNCNAIERLMAPNGIAHGLPDEPTGPAAFKTFFDSFNSQYKDIDIVVEDVISEDDMEVARTTVNLTDRASDTKVSFSGICIVRVENGQIAEAWNCYDFLNMYQQLGYKLSSTEEISAN